MTIKSPTTFFFSALLVLACTASKPVTLGESDVQSGSPSTGGAQGGAQGGGQPGTGGSVILGGTTGMGGTGGTGTDCMGLQCQIVSCPAGSPKTTITGRVFDPAGKVPLYNVVVYVPNEELREIPTGAACDTCSSPFSGRPIAVGLSGPDGTFTVSDAPSGANIPLVVQVGKWRRAITLPSVAPCAETAADPTQTRLPRNQVEGHIPKIAIATGGSDALECLLRKIGVTDSEFGNESGAGRVHLYAGFDASTEMADGTQLTHANGLWSNAALLQSYDIMLLSCEGNDNLFEAGEDGARTVDQFSNVRAFADSGGRIFGSHWHHGWIKSEISPYPEVVAFSPGAHGFMPPEEPITVSVDTSFPKGEAFGDWLVNVDASTTHGSIDVKGAEHSVDAVVGSAAQRWIYGVDPERDNSDMLQYFSFNTPIGETECGRMVFSDLHVSAGPGTDAGGGSFPDGCNTTDLSPQEKALEFMLFDLSSCIQPDTARPVPPPVVRSQ